MQLKFMHCCMALSAWADLTNCVFFAHKVKISFSQLAPHSLLPAAFSLFLRWLVGTGVLKLGQVCCGIPRVHCYLITACADSPLQGFSVTSVEPEVQSCCSLWLCTHTRCGTGFLLRLCWGQPRLICCHGGLGACCQLSYHRVCTTK